MGQPWGLSGPQFLWVYIIAIVVAVVIPLGVYTLFRREPAPRGNPRKRPLHPFEVAYLKGGRNRVAQVVMTELASAGALRVSSSGLATVVDRDAWARTQAATALGVRAKSFPKTGATSDRVRQIRRTPGIRLLRRSLKSDRLIGPAAWENAPRTVTFLLVVALLGLGIARLAEGISNGRPTGDLKLCFIAAVIVSVLLIIKFTDPVIRPTALGAACLRPVPGRATEDRQSSDADTLMTGTMLQVALDGLDAVPEGVMRGVLQAAMPLTLGAALSAFFSRFSSGSGSGGRGGGIHNCGGGSNCGGGGGGDGGGGGGCGG